MRISQRMMYNNFLTGMNDSLSAYMETNVQSASQKRINKPSDDPVGMQQVLMYRASIALNKQYETNSQQVYQYLSSADSAMTQAQVILSSIREKMEQASTGSYTSDQLKIIGQEVRELFNQLVSLSNTSPNGSQLFAGHETSEPAYQIGLGVTSSSDEVTKVERVDGSVGPVAWEVSGSADQTVMVRFYTGGEIGQDEIDYVYSKDGGETWVQKTLSAGDNVLDLDGVTITVPLPASDPRNPVPAMGDPVDYVKVEAFDPTEEVSRSNGTMLFVRPTAYYQGDTNDLPPIVDQYGTTQISSINAFGSFGQDIRVRIDETTDVGVDGSMSFSYSLDNGVTWAKATSATTHAGSSAVRIEVPGGGYLDIEPATGVIDAGQQFMIRPRRAHQGIEINSNEFMSTTLVGKDIFGGLYVPPGYSTAVAAEGGDKNIFEVVSDFIAWAECGVQSGCQEELEAMKTAMEGLLSHVANVGGKMNRVSLNITMLEATRDDKTTRMSSIEDIELTELLIKLSQQQMAYQTVLQSSSMIMGLSLTNYL